MTIPVLRNGYIQWLDPRSTYPQERYVMLGDHGNYNPVKFEEKQK